MSLSPTSCCPVCKVKEKLLKCQACKATLYCGRDHQASDRPAHKSACNGVKKAQKIMDEEEAKLRAQPGDMFTPNGARIFEEEAGHFWGILETRPYMRARYGVVEALLKIQTFEAVHAALGHIMEMLRLCRGDNMGVRDHAPALFLRLGKDQDCYDFCKWWATEGERGDYDWGNMELGFLDVKNADAFESPKLWTGEWMDLSHTVAITLIKIRLLIDARALQNANLVGDRVPQEVMDNIRGELVSTIVAGNKDVMESKDQKALIKTLESQIKDLYVNVKRVNKFFWPALLNPGSDLTALPSAHGRGSRQEMQLVLRYIYSAWAETPGAIDMIKELAKKY